VVSAPLPATRPSLAPGESPEARCPKANCLHLPFDSRTCVRARTERHGSSLDLGLCVRQVSPPHAIPRKEVIQPQLPLRLPCYDFVPITRPTLDGCPPGGLAHRLQVLPAFVT